MKNCLLLGLLLSIVSCSSLVDKVEKKDLAQVKKVAIIGFTVDRAQPNSGASIFMKMLGMDGGSSGNLNITPTEDDQSNAAYALISSSLSNRMKVDVMPQAEVAKNNLIKMYFDKKNNVVQSGASFLRKGYERFEAKGIPQVYNVKTDRGEIMEICKSLKVDAVVFVQIYSHLDTPGIWTLGIGRIGSETDVSLVMFNGTNQDFSVVLNQRGDLYKMGDITVGGVEEKEEVAAKAYQSLQSAVDILIERI